MLGGYSSWNDVTSPDNDCHKKAIQMKTAVEQKLDTKFQIFKPIYGQKQIVAGTNYKIRIQVDNSEHLHVKIYQPLPHTQQGPELTHCERGKTKDDTF